MERQFNCKSKSVVVVRNKQIFIFFSLQFISIHSLSFPQFVTISFNSFFRCINTNKALVSCFSSYDSVKNYFIIIYKCFITLWNVCLKNSQQKKTKIVQLSVGFCFQQNGHHITVTIQHFSVNIFGVCALFTHTLHVMW